MRNRAGKIFLIHFGAFETLVKPPFLHSLLYSSGFLTDLKLLVLSNKRNEQDYYFLALICMHILVKKSLTVSVLAAFPLGTQVRLRAQSRVYFR